MSALQNKSKGYQFKRNIIYCLMILPSLLFSIAFHDVPLAGIVLAFKNYNFQDGIFGSPWCGLDNFKSFFETDMAGRLIGNTLYYSITTLLVVNLFGGIVGALLLYEIKGKYTMKICQTASLLPNFISIIAVSYILYLIIAPDSTGILNTIRNALGYENIDVYNMPNAWRFIIIIISFWQSMGMAALYNYGALLAIDPCLYESASLDGANWFQKARYISFPGMSSMICMTLITQSANILNSSMGPYYLSLGDANGSLGKAIDVIAIFTYQNRAGAGVGRAAAIGLFTSVIGSTLVIVSNLIIKKIDEEKSMF